MKIVIINTFCKRASIGKIAYGFYQYLIDAGHECLFLYGGDEQYPDEPDLVNVTSMREIQLHNKLSYLTGMEGTFSPVATKKAIRMIGEFQPDLIQLFNLHGNFINIYSLLNSIKNYPVVYSMLDEYPYLGHCCYSFDCNHFQEECKGCKEELKQYPRSLFLRTGHKTYKKKKKAYDSMEKICFVGPEWVIERAKSSSLLMNRDFAQVDEYVENEKTFIPRDTKELRKRLGIEEHKIVILNIASSNDKRKGFCFYKDAAERMENSNYVFIHVGFEGEKDTLPSNIIPISYVANQEELSEYYSMADTLVCTSIADTMPNVCLDALSCGTPVIGFDITGIPYVAEKPYGIFVEPRNVDQLVEQIQLVRQKDKKMAMACREYALSRYSRQVFSENMIKIYNKMKIKENI